MELGGETTSRQQCSETSRENLCNHEHQKEEKQLLNV